MASLHAGGASPRQEGGRLEGSLASLRVLSTQGRGRGAGLAQDPTCYYEMLPGARRARDKDLTAPTMLAGDPNRPAVCAHACVCTCVCVSLPGWGPSKLAGRMEGSLAVPVTEPMPPSSGGATSSMREAGQGLCTSSSECGGQIQNRRPSFQSHDPKPAACHQESSSLGTPHASLQAGREPRGHDWLAPWPEKAVAPCPLQPAPCPPRTKGLPPTLTSVPLSPGWTGGGVTQSKLTLFFPW